jgi:hypothetical protein
MKRSFILLTIIGIMTLQGCASMISPWTVNKESNSRFIPVEMWTGETWTGEKQLNMGPADFTFGSRSHKSIKGPIQWTHPVTGESLQVYERINKTKKGIKRQLYAISEDNRGLAKVYDKRPNEVERLFSTQAIMFPLGRWQKGEKQTFSFDEYLDGKTVKRTATIHIRRLAFNYKNVSYAIKYDYLLHDDAGNIVFHERFIYGPEKSLMYFKNRL